MKTLKTNVSLIKHFLAFVNSEADQEKPTFVPRVQLSNLLTKQVAVAKLKVLHDLAEHSLRKPLVY